MKTNLIKADSLDDFFWKSYQMKKGLIKADGIIYDDNPSQFKGR